LVKNKTITAIPNGLPLDTFFQAPSLHLPNKGRVKGDENVNNIKRKAGKEIDRKRQ